MCKKNVWCLVRPKCKKINDSYQKNAEDNTLRAPLHNFYWAKLQQKIAAFTQRKFRT